MVQGINRSLTWLYTFSLNLATKHLKIPTKNNTKYKPNDIIRALTYISLQNNYANNGLKHLTKKLQKTNNNNKQSTKKKNKQQKNKTNHKQPDSNTFLYRLKQLPRNSAKRMLNNLNHAVLEKAKQKGAFTKKVTMAIDLTCIPYYGKMTTWINGSNPKQETSYFHTWATLRIVTANRRFTIKAIPIKRGELDAESMAKTIRQLLAEVKALHLKVDVILLDRGFCWHEIFLELNKSGYKYLVALKKTKQVKEAILDYFTTKKGRVRRFCKGEGDKQVKFNVTIHRFKKRKRKRKVKNILELYGAFATNLSFKNATKVWSKLPDVYRRRWGIETGYRVDKEFRALTTSRCERVRFIYFEYMVFLENLWVLYVFCGVMRVGVVGGGGFWVCVGDFCGGFVFLVLVLGVDRGPP